MNFIDTLTTKRFKLSDGNTYERLPFGKFFQLNKNRDKFFEALRKKDRAQFKNACLNILEIQTGIKELSPDFLSIINDIIIIISENSIHAKAVFLKPPPQKAEEKQPRWNYDGRILAQWIDLIASNYHWSMADILNASVDTIIYLIQEIMVREQYTKEWEYSLTEVAYAYDEGSKKSKLQKLPRPYWMDENVDAVLPKTKIPKYVLPFGVKDLSGIGVMSRDIV